MAILYTLEKQKSTPKYVKPVVVCVYQADICVRSTGQIYQIGWANRMWRDRILQAKREKGITTKYMADYAQMSEKTVARMLSGVNAKKGPYIDNVIMLGAAVGLTPREIFSETGLIVGDESLARLQAEVDQLRAERDELAETNAILRRKVDDLKDELIDTHRYYTVKQKQSE